MDDRENDDDAKSDGGETIVVSSGAGNSSSAAAAAADDEEALLVKVGQDASSPLVPPPTANDDALGTFDVEDYDTNNNIQSKEEDLSPDGSTVASEEGMGAHDVNTQGRQPSTTGNNEKDAADHRINEMNDRENDDDRSTAAHMQDSSDKDVKGKSSRMHYVTIRDEDIERLCPGQFLNDTLVDFFMRW